MDFSLPEEVENYRNKLREFVQQNILPLENDQSNFDKHEMISEEALEILRRKAKQEGLWALQMSTELGGGGLNNVGMAACYEEMARSPFGPVVFNSAAPDDGNMMVLDKILADHLKPEWLQPIIDGKVRSSIAMTEPMPGAGSDPSAMLTTATKDGNSWKIYGKKHYITGAQGAGIFILIAKTSEDKRKGLTAFLFKSDQPGWKIDRRIPIMGPEEHGGHCEISFDGLQIPDEHRLLEVGDGLKVTQMRLGRARLTHCMRWLGMSKRALEVASEYIQERESFGEKLIDHEGVQWMIGEAAMEIQIGRLLTMHAAWMIDQGDFARKEISMAKVQVADTLQKAVDTAIQLCGARGYSKDTILEWIYRYSRQARLVDGASEVHKMVLSKFHANEGSTFWSWGAS
ncbi:MAG: (R)-benzylsuccinyl-CoA dehydrogenase [Alphaproteobacteria bacterium MarineAlpha3_Bin7]|nr:MAG: (R)-benzylsuccinyl-CoA dehydrogenase [Alphaproteobacteria bacterium MarineAlpha3_Bin7]|tara:strand:+ start:2244 stop:3446 length:1203 start_codon:yes stop_codon:yes gene_type:complete